SGVRCAGCAQENYGIQNGAPRSSAAFPDWTAAEWSQIQGLRSASGSSSAGETHSTGRGMTTEAFLSRLEGVRERSHDNWVARCPAHDDKFPSLSIREGDDGRVLVHCFAGCTVDEITGALGLRISDLFADAGMKEDTRRPLREARPDRGALAFRYEMAALDRRLRAEKILDAATGLDISTMNDDEVNQGLSHVGQAYADQ